MAYGTGYSYSPGFRQRITLQQAQQAALRAMPGQIVHSNMDLENGTVIYEIFIVTSRNRMYKVEVSARNGTILGIEEEDDWD